MIIERLMKEAAEQRYYSYVEDGVGSYHKPQKIMKGIRSTPGDSSSTAEYLRRSSVRCSLNEFGGNL